MTIKHGPFGDGDTTNWSMEVARGGRIKKVMIRYGYIVDGIGFEIADSRDNSSVLWFSQPGGNIEEIELDSDEYITQISGTHGLYNLSDETAITSLSIHTNKCPDGYGPIGEAVEVTDNSPFITSLLKDHAIIGFSGKHGLYLNSIIAHSRPIVHGPFGDGDSTNWSIQIGEGGRFKKVMIKSGYIVDGIGFEIADSVDNSSVIWFGGSSGNCSEIELDSDEYITQISGTHGWYNLTGETLITSLSIHTNTCPEGYGPFGEAECVDDNSPFTTTLLQGHAIVGFSGKHGMYLSSITAHSRLI